MLIQTTHLLQVYSIMHTLSTLGNEPCEADPDPQLAVGEIKSQNVGHNLIISFEIRNDQGATVGKLEKGMPVDNSEGCGIA